MSIERYSCSVVSIIAWGRRIDGIGDYVAQQALLFMENVNAVIPGQALMEIIPALAEWPAFVNPLPSLSRKFGNSYARWFFAMSNEAKMQNMDASRTKCYRNTKKEISRGKR